MPLKFFKGERCISFIDGNLVLSSLTNWNSNGPATVTVTDV
jgi:hypothetical protein